MLFRSHDPAEDIDKAVTQLAAAELARFRAWYESFDAKQFDAAIERGVKASKLDALADEAAAAHRHPASCETSRFAKILESIQRALPVAIKKLADANCSLLKRDPRHLSLHVKKVGP